MPAIVAGAMIFLLAAILPATAATAPEKWAEPVSGIEFVWVPGGCFMMGQSRDEGEELLREAGRDKYERYYSDELPQHRVCLDGFWLAATETTQLQWFRVLGDAPFKPSLIRTLPVHGVSWNDAAGFARALGEKNGKTRFRLPTEAEWEYAARAGTTTPFATGDTINTDQANYNGLYVFGEGMAGAFRDGPMPAASFPANPFGIFDMHGNVWEWCRDWYGEHYYRSSPQDNPRGPANGKKRVLRGGSWYTEPRSARSANRYADEPGTRVDDYGFRLVAERPAPASAARPGFDPDDF